jgi:hypothetical protein
VLRSSVTTRTEQKRDEAKNDTVVVSVRVAGRDDPDFHDAVRRLFDLVAARATGHALWEAEFERFIESTFDGGLPRLIATLHAGAFCLGVLTDNLVAAVREPGVPSPIDSNDVLASIESAI